jgi:hypothetical protein
MKENPLLLSQMAISQTKKNQSEVHFPRAEDVFSFAPTMLYSMRMKYARGPFLYTKPSILNSYSFHIQPKTAKNNTKIVKIRQKRDLTVVKHERKKRYPAEGKFLRYTKKSAEMRN